MSYDVIVVGSGFGGAVTACRLAEAGARVLVLERGRRWTTETYPRRLTDPWFFDHARPHKKNGWLDLRFLKRMIVAQGAGVGGGSLCYSSVVLEGDPSMFAHGWPPELTYDELKPDYERVGRMLRPRTLPTTQRTRRNELLRDAAMKNGYEQRLFDAPLAVSFDDDYSYALPDPIDKRHTRPFLNPQGRWQGTCVHLGNCDIGCDVQAKNTLDLNYIALAEQSGAQIRELHQATAILPEDGLYRVEFDRIESGRLLSGYAIAPRVVLAAGSLGTTELLLRCRDQFRTLPNLSATLGCNWSANGNVLSPAIYPDRSQVQQSIGPTISAGLDFLDGDSGERFVVEDDGFPNLLLNALRQRGPASWLSPLAWSFPRGSQRGLNEHNPLGHVMVWLGAGMDSGSGQLRLRRSWRAPGKQRLCLDWDASKTKPLIDSILAVHRRLSESTGGKLYVPLLWRWFKTLITVHPLGGCKMGTSPVDGVVDHQGEVFGYPGLFVADGSLFPRPAGKNPSMTIAALAERLATRMCNNSRRSPI